MGQYCYLINKQEKIKVEAYKLSGGGDYELRIEEGKKLTYLPILTCCSNASATLSSL